MLLVVLAVLPVTSGSWILDDVPLIVRNLRLHSLNAANLGFLLSHAMWDSDMSAAQTGHALTYYRPLVMWSYALDWWWGGGGSTAFHVTNLVLHGLTVLLAGRAVLRWSGSATGALLAAAFFGLHPARAESVAWISGRPDVLATLGLLISLEGVRLAGTRRALGAVLFSAGGVVAFASKETALLWPLLVAIELLSADRTAKWRALLAGWPFLTSAAAAAAYLLARHFWLPMRPFPIKGLAPITHAGFVLETLGRATMFFLAPFDLSGSGPMLTERGGKVAPDPHYLLLGAAVSLTLLAALVWLRGPKPRAFWALLAFVAASLPTLNIVWIGGIALTSARFFYLPSLLLAWFAVEAARGRFQAVSARLVNCTVAALAVTLAFLLALQSSVYRSAEHYWRAELRSRPDVPEAIDYFARREWARGENERALARSLCQYRVAAEHFSFRGAGADVILPTLGSWANALPDAEPGKLHAIADFLAAVREPAAPAVLRSELSLEVPPGSKVRLQLARKSAQVQTLEAEIRVRLGQREPALRLIRSARAGCPGCEDLLDRQARVAYRAFEPDLAQALAARALDEHWGAHTTRALLSHLRELNQQIQSTHGPVLTQLLLRRSSELGLYGEALQLLQSSATIAAGTGEEVELRRLTLKYAALAGDQALAQRLAKQLQVPVPPMPAPLSIPDAKRYLAQLRDGCAFPEELL